MRSFDRQTPRSKRFEIQIRLQVYQRARYYDCVTGEFTSQDPLEYVDGMSLYGAYFVPNAADPLGMHLVAVGFTPSGNLIYKDLHGNGCYVRDPNGQAVTGYTHKEKYRKVDCPKDDWGSGISGVNDAVNSGSLRAVDGVHGAIFPASNCMGVNGCNVDFEFRKAYEGTRTDGGKGKMSGVVVEIAAKMSDCKKCCCDSLRMVQVVRNVDNFGESTIPFTRRRILLAGWDRLTSPSRGWFVDSGSDSPYYSGANVGGCAGGHNFPAVMFDAPGHPTRSGRTNVGAEFVSCAICAQGGKKKVLGCVQWGYMLNATGNGVFTPKPTASCNAPQSFKDSLTRFGSFEGHDGIDGLVY